jgi:hypothetical protein
VLRLLETGWSRRTWGARDHFTPDGDSEGAFAKGEIDKAEFEEKRKLILE